MFGKMHIYTVHTKPGNVPGQDLPVFLREGFNWWAFLFTLFWALYERLWLAFALIAAFNIAVGAMKNAQIITPGSAFVLLLGAQVFIGFQSNDWIRARLKRQGYIIQAIAIGDNLLRAQQRFFDQQTAA